MEDLIEHQPNFHSVDLSWASDYQLRHKSGAWHKGGLNV